MLRLKTESGKKTYARRAHLAETPNGFIKDVLGLRQFLLRGLDKVGTEWPWACTAFNIRKLLIAMEKLRAAGSLAPVCEAGRPRARSRKGFVTEKRAPIHHDPVATR